MPEQLNKYATKALEILGEDQALKASEFNSLYQVYALQDLGKEYADLALQFTTYEQYKALASIGADTGWHFDRKHIDLALQFSNRAQNSALEIVGVEYADLALQFSKDSQLVGLIALNMRMHRQGVAIDEENIKFALQFTNNAQGEALSKILSKENYQEALRFQCLEQSNALKYRLDTSDERDGIEKALQIECPNKDAEALGNSSLEHSEL